MAGVKGPFEFMEITPHSAGGGKALCRGVPASCLQDSLFLVKL